MKRRLACALAVVFTPKSTNAKSIAKEFVCDQTLQCESPFTFEKLSCKCLTKMACKKGCPRGMRISPDSTCTCQDGDYIRALFPDAATDAQIEAVIGYGFTKREVIADPQMLPTVDSDLA